VEKDESEYYKDKRYNSLYTYCKECTRKRDIAYGKKNPERRKEYDRKYANKTKEKRSGYQKKNPDVSRNSRYKKKYGITIAIYDQMLVSQDNSCAICRKHTSSFKKRLAVDHNHKTGKVRGLLCSYCNKFKVGRHTLETAKEVYEYLMKYDS
jgi:hypothetical protein